MRDSSCRSLTALYLEAYDLLIRRPCAFCFSIGAFDPDQVDLGEACGYHDAQSLRGGSYLLLSVVGLTVRVEHGPNAPPKRYRAPGGWRRRRKGGAKGAGELGLQTGWCLPPTRISQIGVRIVYRLTILPRLRHHRRARPLLRGGGGRAGQDQDRSACEQGAPPPPTSTFRCGCV
jgi:hypothetical protein